MTIEEAMALLGLRPDERDPGVVREAYLTAIRSAHPDRNTSVDATARSAQLTVAYTVAREAVDDTRAAEPDVPAPEPDVPAPAPAPAHVTIDVRVIADDTIEVAAPPDLAFAWLVQMGHLVGDVTFLDRSASLLQILITFVDEPACQMIFDLQGRAASGTTEIFCTIDSIEDRAAPPVDAVTRFIAEQLAGVIAAA